MLGERPETCKGWLTVVVNHVTKERWRGGIIACVTLFFICYVITGNHVLHMRSTDFIQSGLDHRPDYRNACVVRHVVLSRDTLPRTALASFPGSGNTWTRHLIQQLTGIGTSSIYCDPVLRNKGFPFECASYKIRAGAIVTKTHELDIDQYSRAVVLIRSPYEALLSYYQIQTTGHTGLTEDERLADKAQRQFKESVDRYVNFYDTWLIKFKGPVLLVPYTSLQTSLTSQLRELARFLRVDVSNNDVNCTRHLQEGHYHREVSADKIKRMKELYSRKRMIKIKQAIKLVKGFVKQRVDMKIDLGSDIEAQLDAM